MQMNLKQFQICFRVILVLFQYCISFDAVVGTLVLGFSFVLVLYQYCISIVLVLTQLQAPLIKGCNCGYIRELLMEGVRSFRVGGQELIFHIDWLTGLVESALSVEYMYNVRNYYSLVTVVKQSQSFHKHQLRENNHRVSSKDASNFGRVKTVTGEQMWIK